MSPSEQGMLLVMLLCVLFTVITVSTANKRIDEERRKSDFYRALYRNRQLHHVNCRYVIVPVKKEDK